MTQPKCTVQGEHCEQCGSTDYENLHGPDADQGYSACCNEIVVWDSSSCRAYHEEEER